MPKVIGVWVARPADHQADGGAEADELEVGGVALDHAAQADHAVIAAGAGQGLGDQRQFEGPWRLDDVVRRDGRAMIGQLGRLGALQQTAGDFGIEAADDDGHARSAVDAVIAASLSFRSQAVAQLVALGVEIGGVVRVGRHDQRQFLASTATPLARRRRPCADCW
jgi:hypothetical protein